MKKNKIYETLLLLLITFIMFQPGYLAKWIGITSSNLPRSSVTPPEITVSAWRTNMNKKSRALVQLKNNHYQSFVSRDGHKFDDFSQTKKIILSNDYQNLWFYSKNKYGAASETNHLILRLTNNYPDILYFNVTSSPRYDFKLLLPLAENKAGWTTNHNRDKLNSLKNFETIELAGMLQLTLTENYTLNEKKTYRYQINIINNASNKYWLYLSGIILFALLAMLQMARED